MNRQVLFNAVVVCMCCLISAAPTEKHKDKRWVECDAKCVTDTPNGKGPEDPVHLTCLENCLEG